MFKNWFRKNDMKVILEQFVTRFLTKRSIGLTIHFSELFNFSTSLVLIAFYDITTGPLDAAITRQHSRTTSAMWNVKNTKLMKAFTGFFSFL